MKRTDKSNDKKLNITWTCSDSCACLFLWAFLILLKAVGYIDMHWALVLLGIVWIPLLWIALTVLLLLVIYGLIKLKRRRRRRKNDRRIKRQAMALGVWDKPQVLGGRALEICAWETYGLIRRSGETDAELRRRCMTEADNQYAESIAKVYDIEAARTKKEKRK